MGKNARAVILAYDTELPYEKLSRSALMLQKPEVLFLATHPDLVSPIPGRSPAGCGQHDRALQYRNRPAPSAHIFGKPDPAVLAPLLARYDKKDMIMVGDRLSTDKKLCRKRRN